MRDFDLPLWLFFYAGLAPFKYKPASEENMKCNNLQSFYKVLPILIALTINFAYFTLILTHNSSSDSVESIITFLGLSTMILTNIVSNVQSCLYKLVYWSIIRRIEKIAISFHHQLTKNFNYSKLIRRFLFKIFFLVGLPIVTLVVSHIVNSSEFEMKNSLKIMQLLVEICFTFEILHPIFYIDVVQMFTQNLNSQLQLLSTTSSIRPISLTKIKFQMLKTIKRIHFDMWKLFQDLNIYFGWSVLFMFTRLFIQLTYHFYQLFVSIQVYNWKSLRYIG